MKHNDKSTHENLSSLPSIWEDDIINFIKEKLSPGNDYVTMKLIEENLPAVDKYRKQLKRLGFNFK